MEHYAANAVRLTHIGKIIMTEEFEGIVGITAMVMAIFLFVWTFRQVWNRVISRRLGIQQLTFSEAYAITILFFAITNWF